MRNKKPTPKFRVGEEVAFLPGTDEQHFTFVSTFGEVNRFVQKHFRRRLKVAEVEMYQLYDDSWHVGYKLAFIGGPVEGANSLPGRFCEWKLVPAKRNEVTLEVEGG